MSESEKTLGREIPQINAETGLSQDYINEFAAFDTALKTTAFKPSQTLTLLVGWAKKRRFRHYGERYAAPNYAQTKADPAHPEQAAAVAKIDALMDECWSKLTAILNDSALKTPAKIRELRAELLPRFTEVKNIIDPGRASEFTP